MWVGWKFFLDQSILWPSDSALRFVLFGFSLCRFSGELGCVESIDPFFGQSNCVLGSFSILWLRHFGSRRPLLGWAQPASPCCLRLISSVRSPVCLSVTSPTLSCSPLRLLFRSRDRVHRVFLSFVSPLSFSRQICSTFMVIQMLVLYLLLFYMQDLLSGISWVRDLCAPSACLGIFTRSIFLFVFLCLL